MKRRDSLTRKDAPCFTRKKEKPSIINAREELKKSILCYHKNLKGYIDCMNTTWLLAYCHPSERYEFAKRLNLY